MIFSELCRYPANKEIGLPDPDYFHCGNVEELASRLQQVIDRTLEHVEYDMSKYDWDKITNPNDTIGATKVFLAGTIDC